MEAKGSIKRSGMLQRNLARTFSVVLFFVLWEEQKKLEPLPKCMS